ncbi:MAG TPA: DUF309 domain-containing protein [Gemmataceae bacterium]|jgi:hypothetical protein
MAQAHFQRLVPDEPFPSYTFVPGRAPHPRSDPVGHSFGVEDKVVSPLDPERWRESRTYLYGLDLLNAQFFWEAHEQFEGLWLACGRRGVVADFLKGLIKLAAAGVKHLEGRPDGVKSHASRAAELWSGVGAEVFLGLNVTDLVRIAHEVHENGWPATPPLLTPH